MKRGVRVLWLARLAIVLDAVLIPLLPQLGTDRHLTDSQLGILLGVYPLAGLIGCIPMGMLADRWRPAPLIAAGMIWSAAASAAIALWPDPLVIGVARCAQGLSGAAVWTAGFALAHQQSTPGREAREMGLNYSASSLGELAGPLVSGFLADRVGTGVFFWMAAAVSTVGGSLMALFRTPPAERAAPNVAHEVTRGTHIIRLAGGAALAVIINVVYGGLLILAPLLLARDYQMDAFAIGQVFLAWQLVLIVSQTGGGHWGDRAPRIVPIVAGMLAMAAGLVVMSASQSLAAALGGLALAGAGSGVAITVTTPLFSDAWENLKPAGTGAGLAFGVILTVGTAGFTLGNTLGGALLTAFSMPGILAWSAGLSLLVGLGVFLGRKWVISGPVIAPVD